MPEMRALGQMERVTVMGYATRDNLAFVTSCTWDDAPHLDKETCDELFAALPPHQRDARSKGVPSLGSGAIYPIPEETITVDDFEIPAHWPRAFALDVGWNRTAAVWGAINRDTGVTYLYSELYNANEVPAINAEAIKARGNGIKGVIDPASRGRSPSDGQRLIEMYSSAGLDVQPANNAVEAGLYKVWQDLLGGRLKIFKSLPNLFSEFRLYRRDKKGRIVKERDHLMDAMRYLIMSGMERADVPQPDGASQLYTSQLYGGKSWLS